MDDKEKVEKTPEEIYLDELYNAMEKGEDLPEGTIPLQVPSLNDPNQHFRKIEIPIKRKKTLPEHCATTAKVLSALYLLIGLIVYREALVAHEDTQSELLGLLFYVFAAGAAFAAVGGVFVLFLRNKVNVFRKLLPFALLAACIGMLTLVI